MNEKTHDSITLTLTPLPELVRTGTAEHSPLAAEFFALVKERLGIPILAAYLQMTGQILTVAVRAEWERAVKTAGEEVFALLAGLLARQGIAPDDRHAVFAECPDQLALWQYLEESLPAFNRRPFLREAGARLVCGWDRSRRAMAYHLLVDDSFPDADALAAKVTAAAVEKLSAKDVWGVIDERAAAPVILRYGELTPEQKFAFLREGGMI